MPDSIQRPNFSVPTMEILEYPGYELPKEFTDLLYPFMKKIYETTFACNSIQVKRLTLEFWASLPLHLYPLVRSEIMVCLTGIFEVYTYRYISKAISEDLRKPIPSLLVKRAQILVGTILEVQVEAMNAYPKHLRTFKIHLAVRLANSVKRKFELRKALQPLVYILRSEGSRKQMLIDWRNVNISSVIVDSSFQIANLVSKPPGDIITKYFKELEGLLKSEDQVSAYESWVEGLIVKCHANGMSGPNFLLVLSSIGSKFLKELTLANAQSFGSFQILLTVMTDAAVDYLEHMETEYFIHWLYAPIVSGHPLDPAVYGKCSTECPCHGTSYKAEENPWTNDFDGTEFIEESVGLKESNASFHEEENQGILSSGEQMEGSTENQDFSNKENEFLF